MKIDWCLPSRVLLGNLTSESSFRRVFACGPDIWQMTRLKFPSFLNLYISSIQEQYRTFLKLANFLWMMYLKQLLVVAIFKFQKKILIDGLIQTSKRVYSIHCNWHVLSDESSNTVTVSHGIPSHSWKLCSQNCKTFSKVLLSGAVGYVVHRCAQRGGKCKRPP